MKNIKYLLLIIMISVVMTFTAFADETDQQRIFSETNKRILLIEAMDDGSFIQAGSAGNYPNEQFYVSKRDENLRELWSLQLRDEQGISYYPNEAFALADGRYAILCRHETEFTIWTFDKDGANRGTLNAPEEVIQCFPMSDGFIGYGIQEELINGFYDKTLYIWRLDKNGDATQSPAELSLSNHLYKSVQIDNDIIVCGSWYEEQAFVPLIQRIGNDLRFVWEYKADTTGSLYDIAQLSNGNIVAAGYDRDKHGYILCMTNAGERVWQRMITGPDFGTVMAMSVREESIILLCSFSDNKYAVITLDAKGEQLNQAFYKGDNTVLPTLNGIIAPSGDCYIYGDSGVAGYESACMNVTVMEKDDAALLNIQ